MNARRKFHSELVAIKIFSQANRKTLNRNILILMVDFSLGKNILDAVQ